MPLAVSINIENVPILHKEKNEYRR